MNADPVPSGYEYSCARSMGNTLETYRVTDLDGLKRLRPVWRALHAASGGTNPFTQWEWMWHWWRLFSAGGPLLTHKLHIIVMHENGRVRAIFPFVLTTAGKRPLRVSKLHLYGFTGGFSEMKAPLVWPGWEEQAAAGLVSALHQDRHLYQWCAIEGLPEANPLGHWLAHRAAREGWVRGPTVLDYILPLPPTWGALRAGLKRNIKQSLRHCYNSLSRDGHEWEFRLATDTGEIPAALAEFFRLHKMRASMPGTIEHPDYFSTARRRLFLHRLARDLGRSHRFMVANLLVDGKVVASRVLLAAGDSLFLYFSGFDPAWRSYSVMTTLTAECIKMAISRGYHTVNFSTGTDVSKTRWGPESVAYFGIRIPSPTFKGRTLFAIRQRLPMRRIVLPERQLPQQVRNRHSG